jgi:predicted nuclease with RNAse H fold
MLSIDLAADEKNISGIAILGNRKIKTLSVHTDQEILEIVRKNQPKIIGIDAPLSLPHGRGNIEERDKNHFRECDLELRKLGIRFFPITIGGMRKLTKRGMRLKKQLERDGIEVIEIFPGASLDILKLDRKDANAVNSFLSSFGAKAENIDESDAAIGVYTLWLHKRGKGRLLSGKDGAILVPVAPA